MGTTRHDGPTPSRPRGGRRPAPALWALAVLPVVALLLALWLQRAAPAPLPVLWSASAFALRDQHGRPVGDAELRGRVVVANFIFTRCTDICPLYLTPKMREVQRLLRDRGLDERQVALVSFTVDPEHDTPEVLAAYAERYGADGRMWHFLTGPLPALEQVAAGFFVAMVRPEAEAEAHEHEGAPEAGPPAIGHSGRFFVVDRRWRVRALHLAEDVAPATIVANLEHLLAEEARAQ